MDSLTRGKIELIRHPCTFTPNVGIFMRLILPFFLISCAKKSQETSTETIVPVNTHTNFCLADKDLCHDTAWLFWKAHLEPTKGISGDGWDFASRTGQLSPDLLFALKDSGVAVNKAQDKPWVQVLSYSTDLSAQKIAEHTFVELCDSGHHKSCVSQGYMLLDTDKEKSQALFQKACTEQIGIGCYPLAKTLDNDPEKALASLEMGVTNKNPNSTAGVAFTLIASENAETQKERIQTLLEEACSSTQKPTVFMGLDGLEVQVGRWQFLGDQGKACFTLAENTEDAEQAKALTSKSCRMEYAAACQKMCEDGVGEACLDLGVLYVKGSGVEKNVEEGKKFYQKGCELGYQPGCNIK
ncbi:MAG: hypothetical protein CL916_14190 [Deltaproteobacteria bacterium]|nr:hypothetical protein [Deltaproteobacteria bacterium]